jgi:uncharacterized protein (TIGR02246 family)
MKRLPAAVLLVATIGAGCRSTSDTAATPPTAAIDTARIIAAVAAVFDSLGLAEAAGDVAAFGAVFAPNARIDGQGGVPLIGRAAIEGKAAQSFAARTYHSMDMTPVGTRLWGDSAAMAHGTLVEVHTPHGEKTRTEYGRWAGEVERDAAGKWRIRHLIAFLDSTRTRGD